MFLSATEGLSRGNPFPTTNAHRKGMRPNLFTPTVHKVKGIVPQKIIPTLKPGW
jgi:hypothetical protein